MGLIRKDVSSSIELSLSTYRLMHILARAVLPLVAPISTMTYLQTTEEGTLAGW